MLDLVFDEVGEVPSVREEGGKVAGAVDDGGVEVEIERLDGIKIVELEAENIGDGRVIKATREAGWRGGNKEGEDSCFRFCWSRRGEELGFVLS